MQYLDDVFENVYLKDIVERGNLKENNGWDSITDILASSIGSLTNPKKLADTFTSKGMKISETLKKTLNEAEETLVKIVGKNDQESDFSPEQKDY